MTAPLPVYLTTLVGREPQIAEVGRLVRASRLVTLSGPGGTGKTRLAAAVASELRDHFRGQVGWIDLSALPDPELVPGQVAATLGIREHPSRTATDAVADFVGTASALLVLDNCEHVLDACALLADALLRRCPALRILTTSRQALGVPGERAWPVPPLDLPGKADGSAADSGAVQLFVQRAGDILPGFALTESNVQAVARICRRLDGLPLAIELAAARVGLLPPEQLAVRLDDLFGLLTSRSRATLPRHRTLRSLVDWSHALLSPEERHLFARLAVFSGGFTLEAAEAVVGCEGLPATDVLDLLAGLVDKSLVTVREWHGEARYALLETVRAYAEERLAEGADGERAAEVDRLRGAHAHHYLWFAVESAERLQRTDPLRWLERMELEHENLRSALRWSTGAGEGELALPLCVGMRDFWRLRGHLGEGLDWTKKALACPGGSDSMRARGLAGAAVLARMRGDYADLRAWMAEGEALARRAGDRVALADTLTQLGLSLRDRGESAAAGERLDEALDLWRPLGDSKGLTVALGARASIALLDGDTALARALRLEAVEVSRRAGDREDTALSLIGLGEVARLEGDPDGARTYYERSLELFEALGDNWHAAAAHHNLGWVAVESGRPEEAYRGFSRSVAAFPAAGNPFGLTLCLFGLARVLLEVGDAEAAGVALAAANAQAHRVGIRPAAPADVVSCERTRTLVEGALDPETAERTRREGEGLELMEALARAQERLAGRFGTAGGGRSRSVAPPSAKPTAAAPAGAGAGARAPARTVDRPAVPDLRVRALGPLQVFVEGKPLEGEAFGSSKPRELLLLLLGRPDGCTREGVGLAFWPESSAAQVKNSFHVTLHRLRKALGRPDWIVNVGDRYRLDPALRVEYDAARFEAETEAALRDDDGSPGAAERLGAALALYDGDFLEGEPVGDWHLEIRDRLRRLWIQGVLARAGILVAAERFADAAEAYRALLARDRLHEEAWRRLMICLVRMGDRIQALRLYDTVAALLRAELGIEPDPLTTGLYERIQRGEVA